MSKWIDCEEEWAYWINPETFRMPRVKGSVPVGAIVVIKFRDEDDDFGGVQSRYELATENGLESLAGKKEATELLLERMLEFMRDKGSYPPNVSIKKTNKNGNVELSYLPTAHDKFSLRLTPKIVGQDPTAFLNGLKACPEEDNLPELDDTEDAADGYQVEPAKSSRSTCRRCSKKIPKAELRITAIHESGDYPMEKHYHLKCGSPLINDVSVLDGFDDLDKDQQKAVRDAIG